MAKKSLKAKTPPSKIFLEECFASEDERFIETLKSFDSAIFLLSFVEKWLADRRPWAREQIKGYLDGELNLPGHEVVFKRIFNHFRHANDHEMMGVLMVRLDRIVRRNRVKSYNYDYTAKRLRMSERLLAPANKSIHDQTNRVREYMYRGRKKEYPIPDLINKTGNQLFSQRTRNYLRRSAWRYFRYLSYREPTAYVEEIARALTRYRNQDFFVGENIIDNWSLMHACYFHSDSIQFTASHTNLAEGKSLEQLIAQPYQPTAWKTDAGRDALLNLLINANSALVRTWAIELFMQEHESEIGKIDLKLLIEMLSSPEPQLQDFAHQVFDDHPSLPTLSVDQWLDLVDSSHVSLLPLICDAMKKHVTEDRLDNSQLIQLTCAQQIPVTKLGFELLQSRNKRKPVSAEELSQLANCQCTQESEHVTTWAMNEICIQDKYHVDLVIDFFDARLRRTRNAAVTWLRDPKSPGYNDAILWARLIETPYDDVKIQLIEMLNLRDTLPGMESDKFASVWVSIILGVHRGGRTKPKAINQLTDRIVNKPDESDSLLPVLAVAIRSVRAPEMRSALAAVVRLAHQSPELKPKINQAIPELEFDCSEGTSSEVPA